MTIGYIVPSHYETNAMNNDEKARMRGVCYYIFRNSKELVYATKISVETWEGSRSETLIKAGCFLDSLRRHGARCMATVHGEPVSCKPSFLNNTVIEVDGYPLNEDGWREMASTHMVMMFNVGTVEKLRTFLRRRPGYSYPDNWKECVERAVEDYEKLKVFGQ